MLVGSKVLFGVIEAVMAVKPPRRDFTCTVVPQTDGADECSEWGLPPKVHARLLKRMRATCAGGKGERPTDD